MARLGQAQVFRRIDGFTEMRVGGSDDRMRALHLWAARPGERRPSGPTSPPSEAGPLLNALRGRFVQFRNEILVVWYAMRGRDTPTRLRIAGALVLLYLLSPLDLLPGPIPLLGIVDDLVIVPWGVSAILRRLPPEARSEAAARADAFSARYLKRPLLALAVFLALLAVMWGVVAWLAWRFLVG